MTLVAFLLRWVGDPLVFGCVLVAETLVGLAAYWFARRLRQEERVVEDTVAKLEATTDPAEIEAQLPALLRPDFSPVRASMHRSADVWHRSEETHAFFDSSRALGRARLGLLTPEVAAQLGNTATGFGIVGTFVGISLGLLDLSGVEASALQADNITAIVSRLASAFTTSIVGVIVAMTVNLIISHRRDCFETAVEALDDRLQVLFPRMTPAQVLIELKHQAEEQAISSDDSRQALQAIAEQLGEKLTKGFDEALQNRLGPALESITGIVKEQADGARQNAAEEMKNLAHDLFAGVKDSIQEMGSGISGAAGRIDGVMANVTHLAAGFETAMNRQAQLVEEQATALGQAQSVSEVAAETFGQFGSTFDRLDTVFAHIGQLQQKMGDSGKEQEERQTRLAARNEEIVKLISAAQESFGASAADMARIGPELREAVSGSTEAMLAASQRLARTVEAFENKLGEGVEVVDKVSQRFETVGDRVDGRVEKEEALLTQYGETHREAQHAFSAVAPIMSALRESAEEVTARERSAREVVQRLGEFATSLSATTSSLRDELATAADRMSVAAKHIQANAKAQETWQSSAEASVKAFAEQLSKSVSDSVSQIDGELSKAVNGLGAPIKDLEDLLDSLEGTARGLTEASERRRGRG